MTIKIEKFYRKSYPVDVVPVTAENIEEVAAWTHGEVRSLNTNGKVEKYVKINVYLPKNERQTQAFVGDRILYAGGGFKIFGPRAFAQSFVATELEARVIEVDVPVNGVDLDEDDSE